MRYAYGQAFGENIMKRCALIVVLCLMTSLLFADPVYLDCSFSDTEGGTREFTVKLDEDTGKITFSSEFEGTKQSFNTEGFFAPNEITFQKITSLLYVDIIEVYSINRTDLAVEKTITDKANDPRYPQLDTDMHVVLEGACEIIEIKGRKI